MIPIGPKKPRKTKYDKKKYYWFKVWFGKWDEEGFDPEASNVYVESIDAIHAAKQAVADFEVETGEIVIGVEFLGYKQIKT